MVEQLNLSELVQVNFPENQYYREETQKTQIILHHTVSGPGVRGDIQHWLSLADRIATCIIVGDDGIANQCFSSKYWAHHIGVKSTYLKANGFADWTTRNVELNRASIAIEIDNWGGLILGDGTEKQFGVNKYNMPNMIYTMVGKFYAAYGNAVDCEVQEYPQGFRGYKYYEKYCEAQLVTVCELIKLWHIKYGIPIDYHEDMWGISKNALGGTPGIWTHVCYREDKSDCHPQPELIEMLKSLK